MMHLGLHSEAARIFRQTMLSHHEMRVLVHTTNLDGDYDADLSALLIDGQVDIDGTADVTRTASLTLIDPGGKLDFAPDSPNEVALFLNQMLKVEYGIKCHLNGEDQPPEWVDIPLFLGPISTLSRTGPEVAVEAQGKESLGMGAAWRTLTIPKRHSVVDAIRIILRERGGEAHFDLPGLKTKLKKTVSLGRSDVPWTRAKGLAHSLGDWQLFYDGAGRCRMRRRPATPVFTYGHDAILGPVQVSYTQENLVNCVFVRGGVPDHGKVRIATEVLPPLRHPLSPNRLGRHNAQGEWVPRYLMQTVENTQIRTQAKARQVARNHLSRGMAEGVEVSFDAMPVPTLEPGDMVRADTDSGTVTFRLETFSVPLVAGSPMTVGYNRNLRRHVRHVRSRRRTPEWGAALQARHAKQVAAIHKSQQGTVEKQGHRMQAARAKANHPAHRATKHTQHTKKSSR